MIDFVHALVVLILTKTRRYEMETLWLLRKSNYEIPHLVTAYHQQGFHPLITACPQESTKLINTEMNYLCAPTPKLIIFNLPTLQASV